MPLTIYFMMCTKLYTSSTPLEGTAANTKKKPAVVLGSPEAWLRSTSEMVFPQGCPSEAERCCAGSNASEQSTQHY